MPSCLGGNRNRPLGRFEFHLKVESALSSRFYQPLLERSKNEKLDSVFAGNLRRDL